MARHKACSILWDPKDVVMVRCKKKDGSAIEVKCPLVVDTYNKLMGGVDRGDQYRRSTNEITQGVYMYIFGFSSNQHTEHVPASKLLAKNRENAHKFQELS